MNRTASLQLDVRLVSRLETAIDQWLAARFIFQTEPSGESLFGYNAVMDDLEEASGRRFPPRNMQTRRVHSSGSDAASSPPRPISLQYDRSSSSFSYLANWNFLGEVALVCRGADKTSQHFFLQEQQACPQATPRTSGTRDH
jgi:hypothetical protein